MRFLVVKSKEMAPNFLFYFFADFTQYFGKPMTEKIIIKYKGTQKGLYTINTTKKLKNWTLKSCSGIHE